MKIHNQIIKVIISVIVIVATIIGVSYAYFTTNINVTGSGNIILTTKNFNVSLVDNSRTSGLLIPINDSDYLTKAADSYFNVNITSGSQIAFNLKYQLYFDSAISTYSAFKWKLTDGSGTSIDQGTLTNCTNYDNVELVCVLKENIIQTVSSNSYHLYFWLSDDGSNQNEFINNDINGKIIINAVAN